MNRQVVPSIILSVMIVSFFGVVLFERDPRHTAAGAQRSPAREGSGPADPTRPSFPDSTTGKSSDSQERIDDTSEIRPGPPSRAGVSVSTLNRAAAGHPPVSVRNTPRQALGKPAARSVSTGGVVVEASARRGESAKLSASGGSRKSRPESEVRSRRSSAFATVEAGETLEDVAIRIYGGPDRIDTLWRANRDVLPRLNSPVAQGMVLRTPAD